MENTEDRFELRRFLAAQDPVIAQVVQELRAGRKRSHWMWFIFPQLTGLGSSPTARFYAISSLREAKAYLAEPVLGARLRECTNLVNAVEGRSANEIFGSPDDMKFRSSMTLFHAAAPEMKEFAEALEKYFEGEGDSVTIRKLSAA